MAEPGNKSREEMKIWGYYKAHRDLCDTCKPDKLCPRGQKLLNDWREKAQ